MEERLSRVEWKAAIKTGLAAGMSLFLAFILTQWLQRPDIIVSGLWATLAALVVQQTHLGRTYQTAWLRLLGVFLGCFMGGLFTTFLGSNPLSLTLSIFLTTVLCSIFYIKDSTRIACLSVAAVMVLWGLKSQVSPWTFAFYRFIDSCLGVTVAVIIAHTLWPAKVSAKIGSSVAGTFRALDKLYLLGAKLKPLVDGEVQQFRLQNQNIVELLWKNRQILEDSKLELLTKFSSLDDWKLLYYHLDITYERINALRRVTKEQLTQLIDHDLQIYSDHLIQETHAAFELLASAMDKGCAPPELGSLERSNEQLTKDLLRLRNDRPTRSFDLEAVEGFYVFFYSLRSVAEELIKIRKHLVDLQSSD